MFNWETSGLIRVPKAAEILANRVRAAIVRGRLKTGDSLPPLRRLMADFQVSLPTAREGLRILEAEGLVAVSLGARGGARIMAPNESIVARAAGLALQLRGATLRDVYEARILLEGSAARLAAERNPAEAADALRTQLAREREVIGDDALDQAVSEFHCLIPKHCGNVAVGLLAMALGELFSDALRVGQAAGGTPRAKVVEERRVDLASHERLADYIDAGRGAAAEAHWMRHMQDTGRVWLCDAESRALADIFD
jgi:DNA-binding FadR family transcriptional regulator